MSIEIRRISFAEFESLMNTERAEHVKEMHNDVYKLEYVPDFPSYRLIYDAGKMLPLMAFDADRPIGYLTIIASQPLHSCDSILALADHFYVHPDYRRKGVMCKLVSFAEETLINLGIDNLSLSSRSGRGNAAEFIESLGYVPAEVTYTKVLK